MFITHLSYKYKFKRDRLYCGLVGFSGKSDYDLHSIQTMMVWNSLERGEDSTGLFTPSNGLKRSLTKGSHYVIEEGNEFNEDKLFIGHVRAATVGGKTIDNAHPFEGDNYVLAHNGTLKNHRGLCQKYNINTYNSGLNVDSAMLHACIEDQDDIAKVIKEIDGAAALLIHDKRKPNTLYVFRNGERPLFRAVDDEGNMYISSIEEPLWFVGLDKIKSFKENVLYEIVDGKIESTKGIKNVPYSHPISTTTKTYMSEETKWKFLNTKPKVDFTIHVDGVKRFFNKNEWYYCDGIDPNNTNNVRVRVKDNNELISIPKDRFDEEYIIEEGDVVFMFMNHKESYGKQEVKETRNSYYKVINVYSDGDIAGKRFNINGGGSPFNYSKKYNFVKVIGEKLKHINEREALYMMSSVYNLQIADVLDDEDEGLVNKANKHCCNLPSAITNRNRPDGQLVLHINGNDVEVEEEEESPFHEDLGKNQNVNYLVRESDVLNLLYSLEFFYDMLKDDTTFQDANNLLESFKECIEEGKDKLLINNKY